MAEGQINRFNGNKSLKNKVLHGTKGEDFMANAHLQFVFRGQDDDQGEDSHHFPDPYCLIYNVWYAINYISHH